jgi:hypothetical protein
MFGKTPFETYPLPFGQEETPSESERRQADRRRLDRRQSERRRQRPCQFLRMYREDPGSSWKPSDMRRGERRQIERRCRDRRQSRLAVGSMTAPVHSSALSPEELTSLRRLFEEYGL